MSELHDFARRYAGAWCSHEPARVAEFYSENGSLCVNDGEPAAGREAITEVAQGFMSALPDMMLHMDGLELEGELPIFRWTLVGTNSGPGGTGNQVHISGFEQWRIGADGLIDESLGNFDAAEYDRQIAQGVEPGPSLARIWHGWTTPENADAYERLLRTEIFPGIAAKGVAGYRGVRLLRRIVSDDEVEFVTILWFDDLPSVREFAGVDYETAYVHDAARELLARFDLCSQHYDLRQRLKY